MTLIYKYDKYGNITGRYESLCYASKCLGMPTRRITKFLKMSLTMEDGSYLKSIKQSTTKKVEKKVYSSDYVSAYEDWVATGNTIKSIAEKHNVSLYNLSKYISKTLKK